MTAVTVHFRQIPQNDLFHCEGEADPSFLDLEEAQAEATGPLCYDLQIGTSAGGLFATGTLRQKVRMTCVSCLQPFELEIISDNFAFQKDLPKTESIDLTPEIREEIQLLIPMHPKCYFGEKKECPHYFPLEEGKVISENQDDNSVWAALDGIVFPSSDHTKKREKDSKKEKTSH